MKRLIIAVLAIAALSMQSKAKDDSGYAVFLNGGSKRLMFNLGPTGIWAFGPYSGGRRPKLIDNFFIVDRVEAGSPAHGVVLKGDVITGLDGVPFPKGKEPRYAFASAIIKSESSDGRMNLDIIRGGEPSKVTVKLKLLPDYSPTWPFNCKRSDTIIYNACDYLAREQMPEGDVVADDGYIGPLTAGLLFLASGEPRYLQNAVRAAYWCSEQVQAGKLGGSWSMGYAGLLMAEYYHMTGDKNILPGLQRVVRRITDGQMPSGGWSHGLYNGMGAGYGEVNCAGMVCYMTLSLAKEIGLKVDPMAYKKAKRYFDSYATAVASTYGDHGFGVTASYGGKNGKSGGQGVAHFLAGEKTFGMNYAISASRDMKPIEGGHTGHFFNMTWSPIAASYAPAKDFRFCMDQIGWYFTLARHWRGGLYCSPMGGPKYSHEGGVNMTTGGYGLVLATARRHLRILGAPKGVFTQDLPEELAAARNLHQSDKWDEAIAAVDAFLKKGRHSKDVVRMANELRDKSAYIKEGVQDTYKILEQFSSGGTVWSRPHKAAQIISQMQKLVGEDHPVLKGYRSKLVDEYRGIWRHGRNFHNAYREFRRLDTYSWFIFARIIKDGMGDFAMPADLPLWESIAKLQPKKVNDKGVRYFFFNSGERKPDGWNEIDFNDSEWRKLGDKMSRPPKMLLVRFPFDLTNPDTKGLMLSDVHREYSVGPGGKVYINGVCVLKTARGKATSELMDKTRHLLKKGKNVLAIETPLGRGIPGLELKGVICKNNRPFQWAHYKNSDRDAEFLKLVSKPGFKGSLYKASEDRRTAAELMVLFEKKDFLMPENSNARTRYLNLNLPTDLMTKHVEKLFKSDSFGGRFTAIALVIASMSNPNPHAFKKIKDPAEKEAIMKRSAALKKWGISFTPQLIEALDHEHSFVRRWAASALEKFGGNCEAAKPALMRILKNVEGESRFTRFSAFVILSKMSLTREEWMSVMRTGLSDPSTGVRGRAVQATFHSTDKRNVEQAINYLQDEMLNQIFTAPHGMFSKRTRSEMASMAIENLPKEKIRSLTPRYLESLRRPNGEQLKGCIQILIHLGEEIVPQLTKYIEDENLKTRFNALSALHGIVMDYNITTPKLTALLKQQLQTVVDANIPKTSNYAKGMIYRLENRDKLEEWATGDDAKLRFSALQAMDRMASKGKLPEGLTKVFRRELPTLMKLRSKKQKAWVVGAMARHNLQPPRPKKN